MIVFETKRSAATLPLVLFLAVAGGARPSLGATPDFSREVRPILSDNCFACHGPDSASRKARLRLDVRENALRGGKSELPALVPGKPAESELFLRITASDTDEVMPPPDSHKKLTPAQIDILRRWIKAGAPYAEHWAFVAPVRPAVPAMPAGRRGDAETERRGDKIHLSASPRLRVSASASSSAASSSSAIDAFVRERLARENLAASPPADAATLCRRLHLDLVGLPPAPAEVDAFAAAYIRAPDAAVTNLVDRLLASPHHGEKFARHWLDAARYADSDGYEKDKRRTVWPYRDYVIDALNRDLPYDQFLIEQLAGDLLPSPTPQQIAATGFLRMSMLNEEGAVDPEQFRMEAIVDRMDVVGKSMLGLTFACAQCHSHKYDPLTHEEYYRLFAYLNNDYEAMPAYHPPAERRVIAGLQREIERIEQAMRARLPDWAERLSRWENERHAEEPAWTSLALEYRGDNSQRFERLADGSLIGRTRAPGRGNTQFKTLPPLRRITGFRLELFTHPDLPAGGPGRSYKGAFALSEFEVRTKAQGIDDPDKTFPTQGTKKMPAPPSLKFTSAAANANPPLAELEERFKRAGYVTGAAPLAIDGNRQTAWGSDIGPALRNADHAAVFWLAEPLTLAPGEELFVTFAMDHGGSNDDVASQAIGRFRVRVTDSAAPPQTVLPPDVLAALAVPREQRSAAEAALIFRAWCGTVPEWKEENRQIAKLRQRWPENTTMHALQRRSEPRVTSVLDRGDWLKPLRPVQPGTPAFLHAAPTDADGSRLALARWLVDARSPTTARVFVNRIWQSYFGVGLVATPEDFGFQGEPPSHPALLDWLACEFMQPSAPGIAPWSMKHLHRLITNSATYRQSSRVDAALLARDPANRLLARGPRFRAEAEVIRDIALAASGLLNPRIGGPSVMPPAPADLFLPPASYAPFPWVNETGAGQYRRALYTFRRRSTPYPALQVFDAPNGETACVRRLRSNTPLQALTLLNEPIFMESAVALARRTLIESGPGDEARAQHAFRLVVGRTPDREELAVLLQLARKQRDRYTRGQLDPAELLPPDVAPPLGASVVDWSALTIVARAILNLDETITKE